MSVDMQYVSYRNNSRSRGRESGQVLVSASIAIFVLIGFAGLAADAGYLEHVKRRMQTAADAGALAAAQVLVTAGSSPCLDPTASLNVTAAAQADSALNGFTNGSNNIAITVNCPPTSGAYAGNNSAVEVIVKQSNQPSFFMAALGYSKATVAARAVGHLASADPCLIALSPTGIGINMIGAGNVTLGCAAFVDSTASNAIDLTGLLTFTATAIGVAAPAPGYQTLGFGSINPSIDAGLAPIPDPLSNLASPPTAPCGPPTSAISLGTGTFTGSANQVNVIGSATVTMNPGVYCGGINIVGTSIVTFNPGTYIIAGGGLNSAGAPSLIGTGGVFFYFTGTGGSPSIPGETAYGGLNVTGAGPMTFNAPSSGAYQGILFASDRTITSTSPLSLTGSTTAIFNGIMYFPHTDVNLVGAGGIVGGGFAGLVANKVTLAGAGTITFDPSAIPGGSPIHKAVLGE